MLTAIPIQKSRGWPLNRGRTVYQVLFIYVVVQCYPWFKFYFLLFLGMVMYDNEFQTKENKI